jgi:hypothetical protein
MKPARHPAASQRRCAAVRRRRRFRPPLNRELTRAYPRRAVLEAVCRRQRDRRRAGAERVAATRPRFRVRPVGRVIDVACRNVVVRQEIPRSADDHIPNDRRFYAFPWRFGRRREAAPGPLQSPTSAQPTTGRESATPPRSHDAVGVAGIPPLPPAATARRRQGHRTELVQRQPRR